MNHALRISIITPSFNQGAFIGKTINSVLSQGYADFEHIIIDGGSEDDTVDILQRHPHLRWVSEPDEGQADALNKGLQMATGEIVGWINSDDYYEPNTFHEIARQFYDPAVQWIVGNVTNIDLGTGKEQKRISPTVTYEALLENPDMVRQPPTFFRRSILDKVGGWSAEYYMVMDYDLWLRLARITAPKMMDLQVACFTIHPGQKSCLQNNRRQYLEIGRLLEREKVPFAARMRVLSKKRWYLLKGYAKQGLLASMFWRK